MEKNDAWLAEGGSNVKLLILIYVSYVSIDIKSTERSEYRH